MEDEKRKFFFEVAFQNILKTERGYVDHPLDRGGPTNYGVTISALSDHLGREIKPDEVRNISIETVKEIYKQNYWDRLKLSDVNDMSLSFALFDQCVNRGTRKVSEQIQKIIGVLPDGVIGQTSIKAINSFNPKKLLLLFIKETQLEYIRIVIGNPGQLVFLKGWIIRSHKLLDMV